MMASKGRRLSSGVRLLATSGERLETPVPSTMSPLLKTNLARQRAVRTARGSSREAQEGPGDDGVAEAEHRRGQEVNTGDAQVLALRGRLVSHPLDEGKQVCVVSVLHRGLDDRRVAMATVRDGLLVAVAADP